MKHSNSTDGAAQQFSASDGRRFAFPVGTAFLVLTAILWWRQHWNAMWVMAGLGVLLWTAGVTVPARLGPVYRGWMKMALMISKVTTPIFMAVVYFGVITPTGWVMRAFGHRPLHREADNDGFWRSPTEADSRDLRRQF